MSVTVSNKWLLAPKFAETVKKVSNYAGFPSIKDSYNASRLVEQLESELKTAQALYIKIVQKYAPLLGKKADEAETQESAEKVKAKADYQKEMTELLELSVVLQKRNAVKIEHLEKLALAPAEILCISQILDFSSLDASAAEEKAKELASLASELVSPQP